MTSSATRDQRQNATGTIAAPFAAALLKLAEAKGANGELLLQRAGLTKTELEGDDGRVPLARYVALMRGAKQLCKDPALALHFGEAFETGEMSVVGLLGGQCQAIADGVALLNRYSALIVDLGSECTERFRLRTESASEARLIDTRRNANEFPELTESTFARMASALRRQLGPEWPLRAVFVTHPQPSYIGEYDRIFGAATTFNAAENALVFEASWLAQAMPAPPSRYATSIFTAHANALLTNLENEKSWRGRVERVLIATLPTGESGVALTARKLGLSRQTLFRQLKAEGVNFEQVLDDLRYRLARDCLTVGKRSITQTAYALGFSEPAAFSRAFKRWTGMNPRCYSRSCATPPPVYRADDGAIEPGENDPEQHSKQNDHGG